MNPGRFPQRPSTLGRRNPVLIFNGPTSEGRDSNTVQQSLDAREFGGNDQSPICPRARGNDDFLLSSSLAVAAPRVGLHEVAELRLLAWIALLRKESYNAERHLVLVGQISLCPWKTMLNDFNCVDDGVGAMLAVNGRSWVVVLHVVSGLVAFEGGHSDPWSDDVEGNPWVGHQYLSIEILRRTGRKSQS